MWPSDKTVWRPWPTASSALHTLDAMRFVRTPLNLWGSRTLRIIWRISCTLRIDILFRTGNCDCAFSGVRPTQSKVLEGAKYFDVTQATVFDLGYRLSKHKTTRYSRNFGAMALLTPWVCLCVHFSKTERVALFYWKFTKGGFKVRLAQVLGENE